MKNIKSALIILVAAFMLYSCSPADGNYTGSEYMPDMGHSIAQEANVFTYYYHNTWDSSSVVKLKEVAKPGLPVEGTVPRGYAGVGLATDMADRMETMKVLAGENSVNGISVPVNGSVPFYYDNTEEERTRAIAEIIDNPFPITADGLERGKDLYNKFCGICHGEKGDGLGWLVADDNKNAKYPAAPANFLLDEHLNASNGRYYFAIMHGKNVMGAYKDKISYEERWQVIHWIRALQAKEKKLEYSEEANTLNTAFGTPMAQVTRVADAEAPAGPAEETKTKEDHGDDHSNEGGEHQSDGNHGGGQH
jgi:mono/diheme cytochrome c family protein